MMEKDQVRFSQRALSALLSVLLATQPLLPAVAATIAPWIRRPTVFRS